MGNYPTAGYFTFKKLTDFAAETILHGLITHRGTEYLIGLGLAIIGYFTLVKAALLVISKFEIPLVNSTDYTSLLHL